MLLFSSSYCRLILDFDEYIALVYEVNLYYWLTAKLYVDTLLKKTNRIFSGEREVKCLRVALNASYLVP